MEVVCNHSSNCNQTSVKVHSLKCQTVSLMDGQVSESSERLSFWRVGAWNLNQTSGNVKHVKQLHMCAERTVIISPTQKLITLYG